MDDLSIGMLLPSSSIRPLGKQFNKGFKKGLKEVLGDKAEQVEIHAEMTGNGSFANLDQSLNKLFGYHGVDAVVGISSAYVLTQIADRFSKEKAPFICNNLGEHLQALDAYNDHVLLNSEYLWQQCWLMGQYAATHIGKRGTVITSMYDSGYSFSVAFQLGMQSVASDVVPDFHLLPMPEEGALSNLDEMFDKVDFDELDFALALFCGEEATLFLEGFQSRGLEDKLTLFGLPYLMEPGEQNLSGLEVYTALRAGYADQEDIKLDKVFTQQGLTSGRVMGKAILATEGAPTPGAVKQVLEEMDQGRTYESHELAQITGPVSILKNTFAEGNEITTEKVAEVAVDLKDDPALAMARAGMASSWMNPYLGI